MSPLWYALLSALTVNCVSVYGQENEEISQGPPALGQNGGLLPQVYVTKGGENPLEPGKHYEMRFGNNYGPSTTVCVEIKNGPYNPYAVCGPQVSGNGYQQPETKDYVKTPVAVQQPQPQQSPTIVSLPTEPRPVVLNSRGMLIPAPPPTYIIPAPAQPQIYRAQPPLLYQKQYIIPPPAHQNPSLISDGTLHMNCKVGGLKLSPPSNSYSDYNAMQHQYKYQPMPISDDSYKSLVSSWDYGKNQAWNNYRAAFPPVAITSGKSSNEYDELDARQSAVEGMTDEQMKADTIKKVDENKKRLTELKEQIANLTSKFASARASSQNDTFEPELQQHSPTSQQMQQQINSNPEQKIIKPNNQQQHYTKAKPKSPPKSE